MRRQHLGVDALDGADLLAQVAHVAGLVRRLDVHPDEVVVVERRDGGARLGAVVGVEAAGGAGHVDHVEPGEPADAAHEVDGADDGAAQAVVVAERRRCCGAVPSPQNHALGAGPHALEHLVGAVAAASASAAAGVPSPATPAASPGR